MPAALPAANLGDVHPTQEELDRARRLREDATGAKKRSTDTGFRDYVKKHPELNAESSSAELKERCIQNFMILQMRAKGSQKTLTATHEAGL